MLTIKNNLMAENAARHLSRSYAALAQSVERLSSGLRINSAKDDAAGLAVRQLIRADIAVLQQGSRNAQDGVSMLQTAEGALTSIEEALVRMSQLAEQSATGTYSDTQRAIMDNEFQLLLEEITRVAETTGFNGVTLLDGDETYDIHVGSNTNKITIAGADVTAVGLGIAGVKSAASYATWATDADAASWVQLGAGEGGDVTFTFAGQSDIVVTLAESTNYSMNDLRDAINSASRSLTEAYNAAETVYDSQTGMYTLQVLAAAGGAGNDLTVTNTTAATALDAGNWAVTNGSGTAQGIATNTAAETALTQIQQAIENLEQTRASLGAQMSRMAAAVAVIDIQAENLLAAESRISDVDVATEMAALARNQVLAQAGVSMLAQANLMPQMALQLLS